MILGQSYDMTYDNLTRNLKIFCKLGPRSWQNPQRCIDVFLPLVNALISISILTCNVMATNRDSVTAWHHALRWTESAVSVCWVCCACELLCDTLQSAETSSTAWTWSTCCWRRWYSTTRGNKWRRRRGARWGGCCDWLISTSFSAFYHVTLLSLFGHIARMPDETDARSIITASLSENWRKPPGRPRTTWMKTIQQDLRSNNLWMRQ